MNAAIGEVLPLALGVAISPVPIIAAILMLLSPTAQTTSVGFLVGWVLGIVVAVVVFILIASVLPHDDADGPQPVIGVVKIVLGVALLVLALRQWRRRPIGSSDPPLPSWMSAVNKMTPVRGGMLGFALAALNPKNLVLAIAAGGSIATTGETLGGSALAVAVYTIVAGCTVAVPVIGYLLARRVMAAPLQRLRSALVRHNAAVMSVVLLVLAVSMIGQGIGDL